MNSSVVFSCACAKNCHCSSECSSAQRLRNFPQPWSPIPLIEAHFSHVPASGSTAGPQASCTLDAGSCVCTGYQHPSQGRSTSLVDTAAVHSVQRRISTQSFSTVLSSAAMELCRMLLPHLVHDLAEAFAEETRASCPHARATPCNAAQSAGRERRCPLPLPEQVYTVIHLKNMQTVCLQLHVGLQLRYSTHAPCYNADGFQEQPA